MSEEGEIDDSVDDGSEEEEYVPEENVADSEELYEMEKELEASSSREVKTFAKKTTKGKKRFEDDGDDKVFEERIRKHLAAVEHANLDDEHEDSFKDLGHGFILNRNVWDTLYPFQKEGVRWLVKLHRERVGGILADEMGLGKTVQSLAFLRSLSDTYTQTASSSRYNGLGAILIVCPASIIVQWAKYCQKYLPMARSIIFHGSGSFKGSLDKLARRLMPRRDGLFVIVPYTTFMPYKKDLNECEWRYLVLDEAHLIKNPELRLTQSLKALQTPHRLLLTGTPLQNNLKELWSLVDCAYPGRLGSLEPFLTDIANPITRGGYANSTPLMKETGARCATILRNAIQPYLLRRTKAGVEMELNLPKKQEQVLFCELTQEQRKLYVEFLNSRACQRMLEAKNTYLPFAGITVLRKLCNHPHLVSGNSDGVTKSFFEASEVGSEKAFGHPSLSGKLEVTRRLLALWKKQGTNKVLLFSNSRVMLEIVEAMLLRDGHTYLRMDGSTPIAARDGIVSAFSNDPSIFVFVLTTRVGGLGLNLTSANKVLIFDPCWNPSTDSQARERAWRIGQIRDVTIYRLVTHGTIEEKIYHRQLFKEFLAQRVFNKKTQHKLELSTSQLKDLFTLCDNHDRRSDRKKLRVEHKPKHSKGATQFDRLLEADPSNPKGTEPGDEETEENFPSLSDAQREELRNVGETENTEIIPSKCKKDERPPDSGELFDGKYQIPYLVKHTKTRRDRRKEEEDKAAKTEDGVMAFLLKRGVREALNHDAVLGFSDRKKVEEREKRALGLIGERKKKKKRKDKEKSDDTSTEPSGLDLLTGNRKRLSDRGDDERKDDLLSAVRRRKEIENAEAAKAFLSI
ncbi:unnamed protein product, partial [Mesorhabditis belari]|uniref:DNA repair and recombination protein RAD54-like n=1 Tax=Mesorhabditis belari TaxID=2138241 RepID=A0AAF3FF01_9BILA